MEFDDTWILYLHYKDLGTCYKENTEKLMEINNIFIFWQTINNIPKPSQIFSDGITTKKIKRTNATPCAYSFFRENIEPCWEDPRNCNGFECSIKINKNLEVFDIIYVNSIVQLLTNKNSIYDYINGIRIVDCTKSNSVMYRIEFWISDETVRESVENVIKNDFNISHRLMYKSHKNVKENV